MNDHGRAALAGAGTLALQAATYTDMAVRERAASTMPGKAVAKLLSCVGADLEGDDDATAKRREALGTLFGYAAGMTVAAAAATLAPALIRRSTLRAGLAIGGGAMLAADAPLVGLGLTTPAEWPASSWAADVVPHAVYGLATAASFAALGGRGR